MKKNKKESFFWTSYSDLMTSLFFVMLVLFVLVIVVLHNKMINIEETYKNYKNTYKELEAANQKLETANKELSEAKILIEEQNKKIKADQKATKEQLKKIRDIQKATEDLDKNIFEYNIEFQRHTLKNIQVGYKSGEDNIYTLDRNILEKLSEAGRSIVRFMDAKKETLPEAKYMLILEGQASKDEFTGNDVLSYKRALALYNYWIKNGIPIDNMDNCEVIISGSGCSSRFRSPINIENQRFVIHIIPKPGLIDK